MAAIPEKIGKYVVSDEVARGGMGVVYKAMHPSLKRLVVIKKMTAYMLLFLEETSLLKIKLLLVNM